MLPLYDQDEEERPVLSVRTVPQAPDPANCRCTQMWPGHPCGYCHTAEERTA